MRNNAHQQEYEKIEKEKEVITEKAFDKISQIGKAKSTQEESQVRSSS
jgi:hypothetical protein